MREKKFVSDDNTFDFVTRLSRYTQTVNNIITNACKSACADGKTPRMMKRSAVTVRTFLSVTIFIYILLTLPVFIKCFHPNRLLTATKVLNARDCRDD